MEIRTKTLRAKVAPNSEKFGATVKSWGPSYYLDQASLAKLTNFAIF